MDHYSLSYKVLNDGLHYIMIIKQKQKQRCNLHILYYIEMVALNLLIKFPFLHLNKCIIYTRTNSKTNKKFTVQLKLSKL